MQDTRREIGEEGERLACLYLESHGHRIVTRNWRYSHKEIDIISIEGSTLHIVEVKSAKAPCTADPLLKVNRTKQQHLIKAAKAFLSTAKQYNLPKDLEVSFDVASVVFDNSEATVNYYPQAYIPTYV